MRKEEALVARRQIMAQNIQLLIEEQINGYLPEVSEDAHHIKTKDKDIVTAEDIEEICTTQTTNKIFDMVRAVTEKNQKHALELYYDLLTLKEPPMRILFLLAKQFRQLLQIKRFLEDGTPQTEMAAKLGVPSFVVKNLAACAKSYRIWELEQAVQDFVDAEEAVKTGRLGDMLSVELLIVKYSSAR